MFGFDCPGCGLQRSVILIFEGEFLAAFKMYPAIYFLIATIFFVGLSQVIKLKFAFQIKLILLFLTVGTIIISYILKMNHLFH